MSNSPRAFKTLFLTSRGRILYGAALEAPLFIHWVACLIIFIAVIISVRERRSSDKIVLAWCGLGYLGGLSGVNFFQPRYIIISSVPTIILLSRFIAEVFDYSIKKTFMMRRLLFFTGVFLWAGLVYGEVWQLVNYYRIAHTHLEECRRNSYGCKEAAQYLNKIPDIRDCTIITDARMTLKAYLAQPVSKGERREVKGCMYYVVWAPESHPQDYWKGLFSHLYNLFRQRYPAETPVKTIYYPNGIAAIHIFKIEAT